MLRVRAGSKEEALPLKRMKTFLSPGKEQKQSVVHGEPSLQVMKLNQVLLLV